LASRTGRVFLWDLDRPPERLRELIEDKRRVVVVARSPFKTETIWIFLVNKICNVLITDRETALALLELPADLPRAKGPKVKRYLTRMLCVCLRTFRSFLCAADPPNRSVRSRHANGVRVDKSRILAADIRQFQRPFLHAGVETRGSLRKFRLQKRLQPVSERVRNGLYLTETKSRGERIRTSGLLVPKHVQSLLKAIETMWIYDAFD
jgi:hypothetical protein